MKGYHNRHDCLLCIINICSSVVVTNIFSEVCIYSSILYLAKKETHKIKEAINSLVHTCIIILYGKGLQLLIFTIYDTGIQAAFCTSELLMPLFKNLLQKMASPLPKEEPHAPNQAGEYIRSSSKISHHNLNLEGGQLYVTFYVIKVCVVLNLDNPACGLLCGLN